MTEKKKDSLIGFDPLAWIGDEGDAPAVDKVSEAIPEQQVSQSDDSENAVTAELESSEIEDVEEPENEEILVTQSEAEQVDEVSNGAAIDGAKISLEPTINIRSVAGLHTKLVAAIQNYDTLEIDASEVKNIDTASLQLLVVLKQDAIRTSKDVVFDFPSDEFVDAAKMLGIDHMLGVDQSAAGFF